jgi:hypothetical protein
MNDFKRLKIILNTVEEKKITDLEDRFTQMIQTNTWRQIKQILLISILAGKKWKLPWHPKKYKAEQTQKATTPFKNPYIMGKHCPQIQIEKRQMKAENHNRLAEKLTR